MKLIVHYSWVTFGDGGNESEAQVEDMGKKKYGNYPGCGPRGTL